MTDYAKYVIKKGDFPSSLIMWISLIWCVLYRLDIGFAFVFACITTMVIYCISVKKYGYIKNFVISLIICGIVGLLSFIGICILKNIQPVDRLLEFLKMK